MTAARLPASPPIQVEYVVPSAITDGTGLADAEVPASLADVFTRFAARPSWEGGNDDSAAADGGADSTTAAGGGAGIGTAAATAGDSDDEGGGDGGGGDSGHGDTPTADPLAGLSEARRRRMARPSIAALKARVAVPSVVDPWDVASPEPDLLAALKATAVPPPIPVPGHWRQKRKYLQNKRGLAKAPFELPPYIAATGIGGLRDAAADAAAEKSMKRIGRERIRPKMGAGGVPAKVLRDAFLVHATKPRLTPIGDLYYELRETEGGGSGGDGAGCRRPVPGELSAELRAALGMPPDGVHPPPWLRAMQQYGPPPAYPTLRLPGVNAPPPPGGVWGYAQGGWGRPPLHPATGRPRWGGTLSVGGAAPGAPAGKGDPAAVAAAAAAEAAEAAMVAAKARRWGETVPDDNTDDTDQAGGGPLGEAAGDADEATAAATVGAATVVPPPPPDTEDGAGAGAAGVGVPPPPPPPPLPGTAGGPPVQLRKGGPASTAAGAVGAAAAEGAAGGSDAAAPPPAPASSLYTVLPAVASRTADGALLGTSHVYAVGDAIAPSSAPPVGPPPGSIADRRAANRKRKAEEAADEAAARQAAAAEVARQKSFKF
ncbi:hypothetical protein MMPV_005050 [Pyropia vietnamensis]